MNKFFSNIKNKRLRRNEYGIYTLDDEGLDRTLGLDDRSFTLTPNKEQITTFAAMTYLFGLFGMSIESFTAIPFGYIATYKNGGTFITFAPVIGEELVNLCNAEIEKLNEEKDKKLIELYRKILEIIKDSNLTLLQKSIMISGLKSDEVKLPHSLNELNFVETEGKDKGKITSVALHDFKQANGENCDTNDSLLCKILAGYTREKEALGIMDDWSKMLAEDLTAIMKEGSDGIESRIDELTDKHKFASEEEKIRYSQMLYSRKKLYDEIMQGYILSGYHTYMGRDERGKKILQDGEILNKPTQIDNIGQKIQETEKNKYLHHLYLRHVLNLCSTDYSADVVLSLLKSITTYYQGRSELDNVVYRFEKDIPKAPRNKIDKDTARDNYRIWKYAQDTSLEKNKPVYEQIEKAIKFCNVEPTENHKRMQ